jgi:hypothetical protein
MRQSEACAPAADRAGRDLEGFRHRGLGDPVVIVRFSAAARVAHTESVSAVHLAVTGLQT